MRFRGLKLGYALGLFGLTATLTTPLYAAGTVPTPTPLATNEVQGSIRTDGQTIVWERNQNYPPHSVTGVTGDIYAVRPAGGPVFPVATGPTEQATPDIDRGVVVWSEGAYIDSSRLGQSDIRGKDLSTGREFVVTATKDATDYQPALWGNMVVWASKQMAPDGSAPRDASLRIMARDITTMAAPRTLATIPAPAELLGQLEISGDRVVWHERTGEAAEARWRLVAVTISTGARRVIVEGARGEVVGGYAVQGDRLVYADRYQNSAVAFNLRTGEKKMLGYEGGGSTDGRYVPVSTGDAPSLYDLATESVFRVPVEITRTDILLVDGGIIVWRGRIDARSGRGDLYAARVADLLPSARRPASASGPDRMYFPETGHTLGGGFRAFWERSGGLPVFGYSLTEEYTEFNRDTRKQHPVQYFERQRYEHHPEHAGTPYEVLLGRLGVEELQRQGRDWQRFPKAAPNTPHYFAETGHAIAPQFWDYWRGLGLEFGDRGVTSREALALFGMPISQPQMEKNSSGDTVLTQWFERARFEYHPNKPQPYNVLLGRLAADQLTHRGW